MRDLPSSTEEIDAACHEADMDAEEAVEEVVTRSCEIGTQTEPLPAVCVTTKTIGNVVEPVFKHNTTDHSITPAWLLL